jgi:hypothetical protein
MGCVLQYKEYTIVWIYCQTLLEATKKNGYKEKSLYPFVCLVPDVGFELTTYRLPYHFDFRRRLASFVVWTLPSPLLAL